MSARGPVHVIRFGLVKVSIWHNQTKSGERHTVSAVRLFRNGDLWQESTRFGRDDLLVVSKAFELAYTWIYEHGGRSVVNANAEEVK